MGHKQEPDAVEEQFLVRLEAEDDPKHMKNFRKWVIILVVSAGAMCATCASSMVST